MENRIPEHEIYRLFISDKKYLYNDIPIEAHYFYKNDDHDEGAWSGKSNLALAGKNIPNKHFDSVEDAFRKIRQWKAADPKKYQFGIVVDFRKKIFYYDHNDAVRYWWSHVDQYDFIEESIAVIDWSTVPK